MECENMAGCPIYNMNMPIDSRIGSAFADEYCRTNKNKCARYVLKNTLGKEFVPEWLMPNMMDEAKRIISQHEPVEAK